MSREMIAKKNLETILSITSPEFSKEYKSRKKYKLFFVRAKRWIPTVKWYESNQSKNKEFWSMLKEQWRILIFKSKCNTKSTF